MIEKYGTYTYLFNDYSYENIHDYQYYYNNKDIVCGYGIAGDISGTFALKMSEIRGVIGIVPHSNQSPYSIICSSTAVIRIDPSYVSSTALLPLPGRQTKISIFSTLSTDVNSCKGIHSFIYSFISLLIV